MKVIKCPHCKSNQLFEQFEDGGIWFPVSPFCCEIMRNADDIRWNRLLDRALARSLSNPFLRYRSLDGEYSFND